MLLCEKKDFAETVRLLDAFLPHVDNWATCDLMRPKAFPGDDGELYAKICEWIASDHVYTVRFALVLLMTYFLDGAFRPEYLSLAASVKSDEYYINTAIAWFFATAIAKQRESAIPFIEECRLSPWVHNKSIQKAIESYRITPEDKARRSAVTRAETAKGAPSPGARKMRFHPLSTFCIYRCANQYVFMCNLHIAKIHAL